MYDQALSVCIRPTHQPAASRPQMNPTHKNKTFTALLSFLLGMLGVHRFYLHGLADRWGWLHAASLPATAAIIATDPSRPPLLNAVPPVCPLSPPAAAV